MLLGCAVWAGLIWSAALVEASTGRVVATSWVATPPRVRRLLLAGLGVALAGAAPGPVSAAMAARPGPAARAARPSPLHPSRCRSRPRPLRPRGRAGGRSYGRGDTLCGGWPRATARERECQVSAAAQRWYARNRAVIGPDPDLIRPGQRLRPPPASRRSTDEHGHDRPDDAASRARSPSSSATACAARATPDLRLVPGDRLELEAFAHRFAKAVVEVMGGDRGPSQLLRWTSEQVYADLCRRAALLHRDHAQRPPRTPAAQPGAQRPPVLPLGRGRPSSASTSATASAPAPSPRASSSSRAGGCCVALQFG